MDKTINPEAVRIIDALGGTREAAIICQVTDAAVSQWREHGIPQPRMMYLRLLRPDLFKKRRKA